MASQTSKGHGRAERRTVTTTTRLNEYLSGWPGVAQVFRLERRKVKGAEAAEVVYGITSPSELAAGAPMLLGYARGRWGIENGLHHTRDVTLGEDRCRVRTGAAPEVFAACRNLALTLLRRRGITAIAETLRTYAARWWVAIGLVRLAGAGLS